MKHNEFGCQRCGAYHGVEVTLNPSEVLAKLCKVCREAYRDFIEGLPEYDTYNDLIARAAGIQIAAYGVSNPYDEIKPLVDEWLALSRGPLRTAINDWLSIEVPQVDAETQHIDTTKV